MTERLGRHMQFIYPDSARRVQIIILDGRFRNTVLNLPLNPQTLDMGRTATYSDHGIPGKSEPVSHYIHGSNLMLSTSVRLEAKSELLYMQEFGVEYKDQDRKLLFLNDAKPFIDGGEKLMKCYYLLDSLCLAQKRSVETNVGAPPFLFVWGPKLSFTCTMRSVKARWEEFQPGSNTPIRGNVDIEMQAYTQNLTHEERLLFFDRSILNPPRIFRLPDEIPGVEIIVSNE